MIGWQGSHLGSHLKRNFLGINKTSTFAEILLFMRNKILTIRYMNE